MVCNANLCFARLTYVMFDLVRGLVRRFAIYRFGLRQADCRYFLAAQVLAIVRFS